MTICLICEDAAPVRCILRHTMELFGFEVFQAETFREAMELASSVKPNLILLDLALPDSEVDETISRIPSLKEASGGAYIHVLTGMPQETIANQLAVGKQDSFDFKVPYGMMKSNLQEMVLRALPKMNTEDALTLMDKISKL